MSSLSTPKPGRLVLVRHGQGSLGTDDYDRLSDTGWVQSRSLGDRLHQDYGLHWTTESGSLKRHQQTVLGIHPPDRSVHQISPALNEYAVDRLIQSAMAMAESLQLAVPDETAFADPQAYLQTFLEWFPGVLEHWQAERLVCQHNGTWPAFHRRVTSPVPDWRSRVAKGEVVVAITSAGVISTIVAHALGESLAWQRELNVSLYNASVSELLLDEEGQWRILTLNCLRHLSDPAHHTLA